jgi:hypothetical protein
MTRKVCKITLSIFDSFAIPCLERGYLRYHLGNLICDTISRRGSLALHQQECGVGIHRTFLRVRLIAKKLVNSLLQEHKISEPLGHFGLEVPEFGDGALARCLGQNVFNIILACGSVDPQAALAIRRCPGSRLGSAVAPKRKFDLDKEVRKLARERVGQVPATKPILPKQLRKKPKYKKPITDEEV